MWILVSDVYDQEMEVLQGSILYVTLFVVKINVITICSRNGVDESLCVDLEVLCRSKHKV